MRSAGLVALTCMLLGPGCGGKGSSKKTTVEPAPSPAVASENKTATAAPAATTPESCVVWSKNEQPHAPKAGVCTGVATSIEQGDCGQYVHIKSDAGQESVFICWAPCEVLLDKNAPTWKGKRLRVRWQIDKLEVAGHPDCKDDAAALVSEIGPES